MVYIIPSKQEEDRRLASIKIAKARLNLLCLRIVRVLKEEGHIKKRFILTEELIDKILLSDEDLSSEADDG